MNLTEQLKQGRDSTFILDPNIKESDIKSNNELSLNEDDSYYKDAFTKMGDELNLEVDNLNVKCITSKNNKFSLDSEGNLVVNSIAANNLVGSTGSIDQTEICNFIYPVGSIYMSVNNVNPYTLFGGVWEKIEERFLFGSGTKYTNGSTGGEENHKLSINEMPKHYHDWIGWAGPFYEDGPYNSLAGFKGYGWKVISGGTVTYDGGAGIKTTGGDQSHNNMPPYLVVNMWKRVA